MDRILDNQEVYRRPGEPVLPPLRTVREALETQRSSYTYVFPEQRKAHPPHGAIHGLKSQIVKACNVKGKALDQLLSGNLFSPGKRLQYLTATVALLLITLGFNLAGDLVSPLSQRYIPEIFHDTEAAALLSLNTDTLLFPSTWSGELAVSSRTPLTTYSTFRYQIKKGDTVEGIANRYGLWPGTVISANGLYQDANYIVVGNYLDIPNMNGRNYVVRKNESIFSIASQFGIDWRDIVDTNNLTSEVIHPEDDLWIPNVALPASVWQKAYGVLFLTPTTGTITSRFGTRPDPFTGVPGKHYGVDIANSPGTPIYAANSGYILTVSRNTPLYGNYVVIRHSGITEGDYRTLYGHLGTINVKTGDYVVQGQRIGGMGSTGRSTGPHLHFSVMVDNSWMNPALFIEKLKNASYVSNN